MTKYQELKALRIEQEKALNEFLAEGIALGLSKDKARLFGNLRAYKTD